MKKSRKGMSHIEVILSFVIFMGFLIFLFAIFNPLKISSSNDVSLDIVERIIKNNVSARVDFLTLKLNYTADKCFYFTYNSSLKNISVKNESYDNAGAYSRNVGGGQMKEEEQRIKREINIDSTGKFFYIYSYEGFVENDFDNSDCDDLNEKDYTFGLFRSYEMVSFTKLENLGDNYNLDYEKLKKGFGLKQDFSFNIKDTSGKNILNTTKRTPKTIVLARNEPIQLVYNNGTLKYAILNIQVW